jgi:hypothetical protein
MISRIIASLFIIFGLSLVPVAASAQVNPFQNCTQGIANNSTICNAVKGGTGGLFGPDSIWNRILNTITYAIGAIAVLMVVIGALRYALSAGDQGNITSAKNTIIYALIALVIAVMANAIVNFVLTTI